MPQVVGEGWSNLHIYSALFLHAFWHLVLSESLAALSKIDSLLQCCYKNWMWYVFTVKLLNVYSMSFISSMFLLISSTARFEFLHLCRWRCVLHLWTWKEFLGKCRNQQFHINLALQVVSLWLILRIPHIITYIYIYHFSLLYTYLRCIILKWWLVEQNSEVKHVDVQSVLVYLCRCLYPP